jgi:hypothetical protein
MHSSKWVSGQAWPIRFDLVKALFVTDYVKQALKIGLEGYRPEGSLSLNQFDICPAEFLKPLNFAGPALSLALPEAEC